MHWLKISHALEGRVHIARVAKVYEAACCLSAELLRPLGSLTRQLPGYILVRWPLVAHTCKLNVD
jgi:hypothetical protein